MVEYKVFNFESSEPVPVIDRLKFIGEGDWIAIAIHTQSNIVRRESGWASIYTVNITAYRHYDPQRTVSGK